VAVADSTIIRCPACSARNRVPTTASGKPRCAKCAGDLPWLVDTTDPDVIDTSTLPVLVDAWAPWCGPCHMVAPSVERLAGEYAGRLKVAKVNIDDAPSLSRRLGVQSIPALFLIHDGEVVASSVGAAPYDRLRLWLERHLAGRS
jgi:thioredoxin 2